MDVAALVISIVSVLLTAILASFGVLLQWLISRDTRQQATEIRQDVGNFKGEASALLGEIRGLTTQTRESQERQFNTMLHAVVDRTTEATTTGTAGVIERIDAIEERLRALGAPSEELMGELHQLRGRVEALSFEIPRAAQRAQPRMGHPKIGRVYVIPPQVLPGEEVQIVLDCEGDVEGLVAACGVATPEQRAWGAKRVVDPGRDGVGMGHTFPSFWYPRDFPDAHSRARGGHFVRGELRWPGVDEPPICTEFAVFYVGDSPT
jgi:hypothetical protein